MNKKGTKTRLVSALLVLVMMFSMLIGTTFAWFTDSVTSSGNKIQAGSLKIDLLHKVGDGADDWTSLKKVTDHKIFNYDKWEPGYTRVEALKIANLGNLALKYQLSVTVGDNSVTLGKNGEDLADVIDVYVSYGDNTAASYNAIKTDSA